MSRNALLSLSSMRDRSTAAADTVSRNLKTALQPALADEHVADWLFTQYDEAFHPGGDRLTPATIGQSVTLDLSHDVTHDFDHVFLRSPSNPFESVECSNAQRRAADSKTTSLVHFTPATVSGRCLLGYVFAAGEASDAKNHPFGALPGVPGLDGVRAEFHGRFVYDVQVKHLLFTLAGLGSNAVGLVSFRDVGFGRRERSFFSVPSLSYSTSNLPTIVLGAIFGTEFRVDINESYNNNNSTRQWEIPTITSTCHSALTHGSSHSLAMTTGNSVVANEQQPCIILNKMDIPAIVAAIQQNLFGTFYAPNIALDIVQPQSSSTQRVASGQLRSVLMDADTTTRAALREIIAQRYYSAGHSLVIENFTQPTVLTPPSSTKNVHNGCVAGSWSTQLLNISSDLSASDETYPTQHAVMHVYSDETTGTSPSLELQHDADDAHLSFFPDPPDDLGSKNFSSGPTVDNVFSVPHLDDTTINTIIENSLFDCEVTNANDMLVMPQQQADCISGFPSEDHATEKGISSHETGTHEQNQVLSAKRAEHTGMVGGGCKLVGWQPASSVENEVVEQSKQHRQAVKLLPWPAVSLGNNSNSIAIEGEETQTNEKAQRLARIEHRKIQNRLSSARSNAKMKERYNNQKKEVDLLRHKAATLREQQRKLQAENDALRTQLAPKSSSTSSTTPEM